MKRLFYLAFILAIVSSCATFGEALVTSTPVHNTVVASATDAKLSVSENKITYKYYPNKDEKKVLPIDKLIENAKYAALQANGNSDVLVNVAVYISVYKNKVEYISVSGYPAKYTDFKSSDRISEGSCSADSSAPKVLKKRGLFRRR